jgi:hypothetical protein
MNIDRMRCPWGYGERIRIPRGYERIGGDRKGYQGAKVRRCEVGSWKLAVGSWKLHFRGSGLRFSHY